MSEAKIFRIVCRDCDTMIEFLAMEALAPLASTLNVTFTDDAERERVEAWPHHGHRCDIFAAPIKGSA